MLKQCTCTHKHVVPSFSLAFRTFTRMFHRLQNLINCVFLLLQAPQAYHAAWILLAERINGILSWTESQESRHSLAPRWAFLYVAASGRARFGFENRAWNRVNSSCFGINSLAGMGKQCLTPPQPDIPQTKCGVLINSEQIVSSSQLSPWNHCFPRWQPQPPSHLKSDSNCQYCELRHPSDVVLEIEVFPFVILPPY
jgi:hypothetical protein